MEQSINVLSKEIEQLKGSGNSEVLRQKQEELSSLEATYESSKLEIKNARGLISSQEAIHLNLKRVISELEEKIRKLESGLELKAARENLLLSESKVSELEKRLQNLSDAEELQKKVEQLEQELAKALGASTAELASGQKQVWVPYNASTFIHTDKLKNIASVSDAPLKKKIEEVLEKYNNLVKTNFRNKMGFKRAMKPLTEDDISTIDINAIEKVNQNLKVEALAFASVPAIQGFIKDDLTPLFELFEDYKVKVSNKPVGFEEYEKIQTGLEKVASLVSSTDYEDFVKEFESKKGKFIVP